MQVMHAELVSQNYVCKLFLSFNADAYLIAWPVFPTARCGCLALQSVPAVCSSPV